MHANFNKIHLSQDHKEKGDCRNESENILPNKLSEIYSSLFLNSVSEFPIDCMDCPDDLISNGGLSLDEIISMD